MDTDLYAIAKAKARPTSLSIAPDGTQFVVTCSAQRLRVYEYATGRVVLELDETVDALNLLQKENDEFRLETFDFGRRMAVEREYRAAAAVRPLAGRTAPPRSPTRR